MTEHRGKITLWRLFFYTFHFLARVSLRGCAKLVAEEGETVDRSKGGCVQYKDTPNFYFTKVEPYTPSHEDLDKPYALVGTDEDRASATTLLRGVFPQSDPTRVLKAETPIKDMLTFSEFPDTYVCVCHEDNCNYELSSAVGHKAWLQWFVIFPLFSVVILWKFL